MKRFAFFILAVLLPISASAQTVWRPSTRAASAAESNIGHVTEVTYHGATDAEPHVSDKPGSNFAVYCTDRRFAQQVADSAEQWRKTLAVQWLGYELPAWSRECPVRVTFNDGGDGGRTLYGWNHGAIHFTGFKDERTGIEQGGIALAGSKARILSDVLPHEILHTILASHFKQPIPRWADEGAAQTVESRSVRSFIDHNLVGYLKTKRVFPTSQLLSVGEHYPKDIYPFYAQSHSLATFLIHHGGQRHYVNFLGEYFRSGSWPAAFKSKYGYATSGDLQTAWLGWVKGGSTAPPRELIAKAESAPWATFTGKSWAACPPGGMSGGMGGMSPVRGGGGGRVRPPMYDPTIDDPQPSTTVDVTPPRQPSQPTIPSGPGPADSTDLSAIMAEIKALNDKIDAIQSTPGPAGSPGEPGPKGDPGPAGANGKDGADGAGIDLTIINDLKAQLATLQSQVADLSKPLDVEVLDQTGAVKQRTSVRLGKEPLRLQLIPVKPQPAGK